jgi:hypothetical protein
MTTLLNYFKNLHTNVDQMVVFLSSRKHKVFPRAITIESIPDEKTHQNVNFMYPNPESAHDLLNFESNLQKITTSLSDCITELSKKIPNKYLKIEYQTKHNVLILTIENRKVYSGTIDIFYTNSLFVKQLIKLYSVPKEEEKLWIFTNNDYYEQDYSTHTIMAAKNPEMMIAKFLLELPLYKRDLYTPSSIGCLQKPDFTPDIKNIDLETTPLLIEKAFSLVTDILKTSKFMGPVKTYYEFNFTPEHTNSETHKLKVSPLISHGDRQRYTQQWDAVLDCLQTLKKIIMAHTPVLKFSFSVLQENDTYRFEFKTDEYKTHSLSDAAYYIHTIFSNTVNKPSLIWAHQNTNHIQIHHAPDFEKAKKLFEMNKDNEQITENNIYNVIPIDFHQIPKLVHTAKNYLTALKD